MSSSEHKAEKRTRPALLLAEFDNAESTLHAAEKVRDAGYQKWDVHTPYPVHGMDAAMGMGDSRLGWLVLVMALLPFSSLGDRIGHRRFYQAGQLVFLVASALCLFANGFIVLLLRALQALGAAMALSVSAAMLRQIYPTRQLGSGMGINSVIVASSSALAPTAGGFIIGHAPWQWVFVATGLPPVLLAPVVLWKLPSTPGDAKWLSAAEKHWLATTLAA